MTMMMAGVNSVGPTAIRREAVAAQAIAPPEMSALLEETIAALTKLDTAKLEEMASAVEARLGAGELAALLLPDRTMWEQELSRITARHRLLGKVLENTGVNLRVLEGLNRRNRIGEQTWVR